MRLTYRDSTVPHTNAKGELWEAYSDRNYNEIINKLAAYEDAEEQGLLVRLPCKVGDTVYTLERFCDGMIGDCDSNVPCEHCDDYKQELIERRISSVLQAVSIIEALGTTVFLTREEAEVAMNRRDDGNG